MPFFEGGIEVLDLNGESLNPDIICHDEMACTIYIQVGTKEANRFGMITLKKRVDKVAKFVPTSMLESLQVESDSYKIGISDRYYLLY